MSRTAPGASDDGAGNDLLEGTVRVSAHAGENWFFLTLTFGHGQRGASTSSDRPLRGTAVVSGRPSCPTT